MIGSNTYYARCDNCERGATYWYVVVDENGDVDRLECEHCGKGSWERGQGVP